MRRDQIDDGFDQLNDAYDNYEKSRKEALENANLDSLLNMSTLSGMITAQNFDMPAGYIKAGDGSDNQWLLRVGEDFKSVDELEGILLCSIDGIGDVRLGDVATLTVIDNAGDAYAKVNGNDAVVLSIFKGLHRGYQRGFQDLQQSHCTAGGKIPRSAHHAADGSGAITSS